VHPGEPDLAGGFSRGAYTVRVQQGSHKACASDLVVLTIGNHTYLLARAKLSHIDNIGDLACL
jgi:hypothetical protein